MSAPSIEYFPVPIATLTPQALAGMSIYLYDEDSKNHTLYRDSEYPVEDQDLQKLKNRGIDMLYVESKVKDKYREYLNEVAFSEKAVDPSIKVGAVAEVIRSVLQDSFESVDNERIVQSTRALSKITSKLVQSD